LGFSKIWEAVFCFPSFLKVPVKLLAGSRLIFLERIDFKASILGFTLNQYFSCAIPKQFYAI
jgi:hypothetical protein